MKISSQSKEYRAVHYLLRKNNGKANVCESKDCNGKSLNFDYALKKGREYSDNPKDYIQLCKSCHRKYDFNEDIRKKLSKAKIGKHHIIKGLTVNL